MRPSALLPLTLLVLACAPGQSAPPAGSGGSEQASGGAGASGGSSPSGSGGSASGGSASGGSSGSGGSASGGSSPNGSGAASSGGTGGRPFDDDTPDLLVFSRTLGFRHESIEAGIAAIEDKANERGWDTVASEDPTIFADESLADFEVVIFLSTTGDVLDAEEQAAFERFIQSGKGYVGVHAASDTEYDWPWYGELVGAYFNAHGDVQSATVMAEEPVHQTAVNVSFPWQRTDEWYGFVTNPRSKVQVVMTVDETSFVPGAGAMGEDHPIAWCREFDGGRSFYTALGHTVESYAEPAFMLHLADAIEWAGQLD